MPMKQLIPMILLPTLILTGCGGVEAAIDFDDDGVRDQDDCAPADPQIFPGADELCDDGVDNDCDGDVDEADGDCTATGDDDTTGDDDSAGGDDEEDPVLPILETLGFESNNGLMTSHWDPASGTPGNLWQWGVPTSGPNAAFSGSTVWATNPNGNYFSNAVETLYLPPLDLSNLTSPTLDFRIWMTTMINDGVSLEVNNGSTGWLPHSTVSPAYNGQDGSGAAAWTGLGQGAQYEHASADLQSWAGNLLWVRFVFRADWSTAEAGVYIDDIELTD